MASENSEYVEELSRPVVKLIISIGGLFVVRFVANRLPGTNTGIGNTGLEIGAIIAGVITLAMVGIIVNFGRDFSPRMERALSGPDTVRAAAGDIVKHLAFVVAIIVAYDGLQAAILPFLFPDPGRTGYDIAFLLLALIPTAVIAHRIYVNIDAFTDLTTRKVKDVASSKVRCGGCDEQFRSTLEFCPHCGTAAAEQGERDATPVEPECPDCGADVDPGASFCGSCGTQVTGA